MPVKSIKVNDEERKAIAEKMRAAFDTLAERRGHAFDYAGFAGPAAGRKLLRDCGKYIHGLLLNNEEHLEAYAALRALLAHNASPLDLCDFMFHCVNAVPITVVSKLGHAGFSKGKLRRMASTCCELAEQLHRLNCDAIPGPWSYLFHVSKLSPDDKKLVALQKLPEYLSVCADLLKRWPLKDYTSNLTQRQFGKHYMATYFSIYICHCGGSETQMSALLRLMRAVLMEVFPNAQQTTTRARKNAKETYPFLQYAASKAGDPLSPQSLRMAVERFVQRNREGSGHMLVHVATYLKEPKYELLRKDGHTFIELLDDF